MPQDGDNYFVSDGPPPPPPSTFLVRVDEDGEPLDDVWSTTDHSHTTDASSVAELKEQVRQLREMLEGLDR